MSVPKRIYVPARLTRNIHPVVSSERTDQCDAEFVRHDIVKDLADGIYHLMTCRHCGEESLSNCPGGRAVLAALEAYKVSEPVPQYAGPPAKLTREKKELADALQGLKEASESDDDKVPLTRGEKRWIENARRLIGPHVEEFNRYVKERDAESKNKMKFKLAVNNVSYRTGVKITPEIARLIDGIEQELSR